jgi:beta-glucosidase
MRTDAAVLPANGSIDLSVDLSNVGNRDGDEVVQLYVQLPESKVPRPLRSLKAFQRVGLRAGETKTLHLRLAARDLAYWDVTAHRFVVEAGTVGVLVGASSSDIRLRKTVQVSGDLGIPPDLRQDKLIN